MKKIYNLLCFTVAVFFMTACEKTDTQAPVTARLQPRPGIWSYIMEIRLLYSMAPVPGVIQDWDILMI